MFDSFPLKTSVFINLNKFKKIVTVPIIFSHHNGMKLEIHHKKKTEKHTKT